MLGMFLVTICRPDRSPITTVLSSSRSSDEMRCLKQTITANARASVWKLAGTPARGEWSSVISSGSGPVRSGSCPVARYVSLLALVAADV
jgi:hypothetical protein